jgi:enoyl-CoA hydratase
MEFKNIIVEIKDKVGILKMNRPNALNALNSETLKEIDAAILSMGENDQVKVVIITGEGKAFVAGADIAEMKGMSKDQALAFSQKGQGILDRIASLDKPVIAAVNGFALGGGCELAMACDIRIASDKAKMGQPEVNLGIIPGFAGTQRLSRLVGTAKAKELIFTADMIDAQAALSIGLNVCLEMATKIASKGPTAVKMAKKAVNQGIEMTLDEGNRLEGVLFSDCFPSGEAKEGMSAFLEKRDPNW